MFFFYWRLPLRRSESNQRAIRKQSGESFKIRVIQSEPKILRLVTILTIRALCRVAPRWNNLVQITHRLSLRNDSVQGELLMLCTYLIWMYYKQTEKFIEYMYFQTKFLISDCLDQHITGKVLDKNRGEPAITFHTPRQSGGTCLESSWSPHPSSCVQWTRSPTRTPHKCWAQSCRASPRA